MTFGINMNFDLSAKIQNQIIALDRYLSINLIDNKKKQF